MIHYAKYDQQLRIDMQIYCTINSIASYMFQPPAMSIFRDMFFERYVT